ncbi:MAG: RusA family crossover junction endodeoxyribonuclease [Ruminococcaceae bacterium]|nr:RusA family crossover junction endodeoxyribonuclease [Oscillospiraceae bacterium]
MNFFIAINPPTTTAQMKQVRVVKGKPIFYDPPAVKAAKDKLSAYLSVNRPQKPFEGPLSLRVMWLFPRGKSHKNGQWRSTRPDTDNLQKMLKDCMTKCHFWNDDAQVAREIIEKRWSDEPCGIYIEIEKLEEAK